MVGQGYSWRRGHTPFFFEQFFTAVLFLGRQPRPDDVGYRSSPDRQALGQASCPPLCREIGIGNLIVLGHTVLATAVSVLFIAWMALLFGLVGLAGSLFRIGKEGFWQAALTGGLLTVLGVIVLFKLIGASSTLLGALLGVEILVDGLTMMPVGRLRFTPHVSAPTHRVAS